MLKKRNGILYYKKHEAQNWREVPKEDIQMRWEQRASELESDLNLMHVKYDSVVEELEDAQEQLNLTEAMLHSAAQDNLAKDTMIKYLEARINKTKGN